MKDKKGALATTESTMSPQPCMTHGSSLAEIATEASEQNRVVLVASIMIPL